MIKNKTQSLALHGLAAISLLALGCAAPQEKLDTSAESSRLATTQNVVASSASKAPVLASVPTPKTVVFVHGAFADGSSWNKVIPLLQDAGLRTISVQLPLTSLKEDAEFARRAIENAEGPVILVGHSWGGMVITEVGAVDKVESLVYVSAFAPAPGKHIHDILAKAHGELKIPKVKGFKSPVVDKAGFIRLSDETFPKYFAPDIAKGEATLLAATQGKLHKDALDHAVSQAAWQTKPSWFIVSTNDQMLAPGVQQLMAKEIGATKVELPTSHVPMLSKPHAVAKVIHAAAMAQ